jgi:isopentenyl phosphate kinase
MRHTQPTYTNLLFLKLGGSLITDKSRPHTVRSSVLVRLAGEIFATLKEDPDLQLVLGHGSGSFGHVPAKKYGTRQGVKTKTGWQGFIKVWREAANLNHHVIEALSDAGLLAISLPPSGSVIVDDGEISSWDLSSLTYALDVGLLPVIYGDVVFDRVRGGTILSTEDLFTYLARQIRPSRILLAGQEPGIWADYPASKNLLTEISSHNISQISPFLEGSQNIDVTGGMASKVRQSLALVQEIPALEVSIFSGENPGTLLRSLLGERMGTTIHNRGLS